jgi:hypothetical protein
VFESELSLFEQDIFKQWLKTLNKSTHEALLSTLAIIECMSVFVGHNVEENTKTGLHEETTVAQRSNFFKHYWT